jgi:hypothetical protein
VAEMIKETFNFGEHFESKHCTAVITSQMLKTEKLDVFHFVKFSAVNDQSSC